MGKTPEKLRLRIVVDDDWETHPKIVELKEKGHAITPMRLVGYDLTPHLVLSRTAWRWDDSMWPMLEITLKAARKAKKDAAVDAS